jgi:hypothetical protein
LRATLIPRLWLHADQQRDVGYLAQAERGWLIVDPFHGPGYPWAIRVVCLLSPLSWLRSAQVVSIAAGLTLTIVTYLFARRDAGRFMAALAATLTAFSPAVFAYSCLLMRDLNPKSPTKLQNAPSRNEWDASAATISVIGFALESLGNVRVQTGS